MSAVILVVDDSPTILRIVESVLTGAGYDVLCAGGGVQGLQLAEQHQPDLILLDLVMPEMTGYQFCHKLLNNPPLGDIPVVLMSSKGEPMSDRFASAPNVLDYVTKPFSPEVILALTSYTIEKNLHREPTDVHVIDADERTLITGPPSAEIDADVAQVLIRVLARNGVPEAARLAREVSREMLSLAPPSNDTDGAVMWVDLSRLPLPEVFQLMQLQQQSGRFSIWADQVRFDIYLRQGQVLAAQADGAAPEFRLGRFLIARDLITPTELDPLLRSTKGRGGLPLGEKLMRLGLIKAEDIRLAIADQCRELVYESLRVHGGRCALFAGEQPPPEFDAMLVAIDIPGLLMEGLRRVDEWGVIEREVGGFDAIFATRTHAMTDPREYTSDERRMLSLVDGRRSVRELVNCARMRPFEACKLLYRLAATRQIVRIGG